MVLAAPTSHGGAAGSHRTLHWLIHLGWIGIFGAALLDSSPIPLPIPGTTDLLILLLVVRKATPVLLVALAVAGSLIGGVLTWSVGRKGGEAALDSRLPARYGRPIHRWVTNHGGLAVAFAALMPPPIPLLPFLLAAGALGVPRARFMTSLTLARTARYSLVAWLGVLYGHQMVHWWNRYLARYSGVIGWCILVLFVGGIGFGVWQWRHQKRSAGAAPPPQPASA